MRRRKRYCKERVFIFIILLVILSVIFIFNDRTTKEAVKEEVKYEAPVPVNNIEMLDLLYITTAEPVVENEHNPIRIFNEDEMYLLAKIAMAEAEGESLKGKALVMLTILNRVASNQFPDTIEEVILQKNGDCYQFTPVKNGRFQKVEPNMECYEALELVISGWDESDGALFFEACTNESTWHSRNLDLLFVEGNHKFYR